MEPNNGLVRDTKDFSNKYNTQLTPEQEQVFQLWAANMSNKLGRDILNDLYDYDMRGAFLDGLTPDGNLHWSDKFKKPNHPTFSDGSIYHNVDGYKGGHWSKDEHGSFVFTPSDNMVYSDEDRKNYWLKSDEYSNGNHLNNSKGERLLNGSTITSYDPSLIDELKAYLHYTSPEDKIMDTVSNGLSIASGIGPAIKGLASARNAIKPVANIGKNFINSLTKGLVREGAENIVADEIDSNTLDYGLMAEDTYNILKLFR